MPLDKARLLAHIRFRADHKELLVYAVLTGLAMAIERGDFDEKETPESGGKGGRMGGQLKAAPAGASTPRSGPKTTPLETEGGGALLSTIVAPTPDSATPRGGVQ
jgi:hypothetical protein